MNLLRDFETSSDLSEETSSHTLISYLHTVQHDLPSHTSHLHETHRYRAKMEQIQQAIHDP